MESESDKEVIEITVKEAANRIDNSQDERLYELKIIGECNHDEFDAISGAVKRNIKASFKLDFSSVKVQNGLKVKESCFEGSNLVSISLPKDTTEIGDRAFYKCEKLEEISLPDSIIRIGKLAFSHTKIGILSIPESVKSIGSEIFANCKNLQLVIVTNCIMNENSFNGCENLQTVVLEKDISHGFSKFENIYVPPHLVCKYQTSYFNDKSRTVHELQKKRKCIKPIIADIIPSQFIKNQGTKIYKEMSVEEAICFVNELHTHDIGEYNIKITGNCVGSELKSFIEKLRWKYLSKIHLDISCANIPYIEEMKELFAWCICLVSIKLPSSIKKINNTMFHCCDNLVSIDIPDGVQIIDNFSFVSCKALKSVTFPISVTEIGCTTDDSIFLKCLQLEELIIKSDKLPITKFKSLCDTCGNFKHIYVPSNMVDKYKESKYWKSEIQFIKAIVE